MSGQTCGMCDSEELCICGGYQQRAATVADNEAWSKAIRARTDELMREASQIKGTAMRADSAAALVRQLVDALEFYGDFESYLGIAFLFDEPCGEFQDDFEVLAEEYEGYEGRTPRPGKRARAALTAARAWQQEQER